MDELKRLNTLIKSVNRGGYHRCTICDTVSNERIETNIGDYKEGMPFLNDPKDSMHFICLDCYEVIQENLQDLDPEDDIGILEGY